MSVVIMMRKKKRRRVILTIFRSSSRTTVTHMVVVVLMRACRKSNDMSDLLVKKINKWKPNRDIKTSSYLEHGCPDRRNDALGEDKLLIVMVHCIQITWTKE